MPMISLIRQQQKLLAAGQPESELPAHQPDLLLIGCVDARKDIISDLGIPKGRALILRNVAALIHPEAEGRLTESAALAFAVREIGVKHIGVMGHTDCGGIRAALEGSSSYSLRDYLAPIHSLRNEVIRRTKGEGEREQRWQLEQEAVKYSVRALRTYDYIAAAEAEGRLKLHGWLLDISTGLLHVWNEGQDRFTLMAETA